jgi:cytochrome c oxidase assembly protein subunit 11
VNDANAGDPRKKRRTLFLLAGLALGMFGFGFAMVPLYGLLCNATGLQSVQGMGELGVADAIGGGSGDGDGRWVTVKFDTTVHPDLPWRLEPEESKVRVRVGEARVVNFMAENRAGYAVTAQAIPSIAPWKAGGFFSKIECFCFTQQTLSGGERKEMPVRFLVSRDLPADVDSITLSYSVMRVSQPDAVAAAN